MIPVIPKPVQLSISGKIQVRLSIQFSWCKCPNELKQKGKESEAKIGARDMSPKWSVSRMLHTRLSGTLDESLN